MAAGCVPGPRWGYTVNMATATSPATRTADPADRTTRTEKGISLARGPALIVGTILLAAGLYLLYRAHTFPRFSTNFTGGTPAKDGSFIFGIFAANGWTAMFTAVCGGLLLFGAAQHLLAKTMSLIVGAALGAAAVISVISGNVLGMASANGWTELGWAIAAVILLFNSLVPRRRRTVVAEEEAAPAGAAVPARRRGLFGGRRRAYREPETTAAPAARTREPAAGEPATGDTVRREPVAGDREPLVSRDEGTAAEPGEAGSERRL